MLTTEERATARMKWIAAAAALTVAFFAFGSQVRAATTIADASPAPSPTPVKDTKLHSYITPYLWLPTIHGSLNLTIPDGSGDNLGVTITPSRYVPKLASGVLFTAGVYKGDWGALTDLIYLNLTGVSAGVTSITGPDGMETIPINTNIQTRFTSTIWTTAATYNLAPNSPPQNFDALLGFRYVNVSPSVTWMFSGPVGLLPLAGSHKESVTLWDGIAGVKGKFDLDKQGHWFAPFYGDIGTGGQNFTWQAVGGVGYGFHSGAWSLVYRNLYYNMTNGGLLHNINLSGAALGYTFKL